MKISFNVLSIMDAESVKFFLNNPIVSIGGIILLLGCIEMARLFYKWVEKTFRDEFFIKSITIIGWISITFLFFAILNKFTF